jgi:hypothetical protein
MAVIAAILLSSPVLGETPEQIRAKLLATPEWKYEWVTPLGHIDPHGAPGKVQTGKVSFVEKNAKLIGQIDEGLKCDNEVTLRIDGFNMENCWGHDLQFARSNDEFKATGQAPYDYTIRPAP